MTATERGIRRGACRLASPPPARPLDAPALVHEAYLGLVDGDQAQRWNGRRHFFAAAAEAMRRILVEQARRKRSRKHGGALARHDLAEAAEPAAPAPADDLL